MSEFHDPPAHLLDPNFGTATGRPRSQLRRQIDEIPPGKMILLDPAEVGSIIRVRNAATEASRDGTARVKKFRVVKTEDGQVAVVRLDGVAGAHGKTSFLD